MTDEGEERPEDFRALAQLAEVLGDLVETLTRGRSGSLSAQAMVDFAHRCMPRTQHTGLLLRDRNGTRTVATVGHVPARLDDIREAVGEGPALDVLHINDYLVSGDLADDPRWPRFGARVVDELGVRSIASYRLYLNTQNRAALVFASDWPYAFDEQAVPIGAICAAYCSLVLVTEEMFGEAVSLPRAAEVHREIGVAAGILLASEEISTEEAFRRLHRASRHFSRSLSEVASHVVAHRSLPDTGADPEGQPPPPAGAGEG